MAAINGAAPERRIEVATLCSELEPYFARLADAPGFKLQAGAFSSITLTQRTLDQIWILGYIAWQSLSAYAPLLMLTSGKADVGSAVLDTLPGQHAEEKAMAEGLRTVRHLSEVLDREHFEWPPHVPRPSPDGGRSQQEKAVADLNVIAAAYVFLHELHHLRCAKEARSFASVLDEELECDAFARGFLLDAVDQYVRDSAEERSAVLSKRGAGIALGCFILLHATRRSAWAGSSSHPPLAKRLRVLAARVDVPDDALHWRFLAALLLAVLRQDGSLPSSVPADSWRDACLKLIGVVESVA
ncbi:phage exclusion protein Lit family protein [Roseisolibacter agri]|nr:phage exclusion protein Lit family protein [Roseisolibacter agri]